MMKRLFFYLQLFLLSLCTVSCEDAGDDLVESDNTEETSPDEPNDNKNTETNFVLASVMEESKFSTHTSVMETLNNTIYEVNGWNKRTVLKSYKSGSSVYNYVYDLPNSVQCLSSVYDMECTLNTKGLISEAKIGREVHTFKYDNKNRLIEQIQQYGSEANLIEYTYDSKYNMVCCKSDNQEIRIEYTVIPAKTIPMQWLAETSGSFFGRHEFPFLEMGLYGNTIPLHLIDRIVCKWYDGGEYEKVYEYTLDENGYVVQMVEMAYYASGTVITTYTFEWEPVAIPTYTNWLFSDITSPYYRYL